MTDLRWVWCRQSLFAGLGADAAESTAAAVADALRDGADLDELLAVVTTEGLTRTPSFLFATSVSDGVRILVRGGVTAVARRSDGDDEVTAGRSATWRDDVLAEVVSIEVGDDQRGRTSWFPAEAAEAPPPVARRTVSDTIRRDEAPGEDAEAADDDMATLGGLPDVAAREPEPEVEPEPGVEPEPVPAPAAASPTVPPPATEPTTTGEFDFSNLLERTMFREIESAAVREGGKPDAHGPDEPAATPAEPPADPTATLDPVPDELSEQPNPEQPNPEQPSPEPPPTGIISGIPAPSHTPAPPAPQPQAPQPQAPPPQAPSPDAPAPQAPPAAAPPQAPPPDPALAHLPPPPAGQPTAPPPGPPPGASPPWAPPPTGAPAPPSAPPPSAPPPADDSGLGDHDGHTISISDLRSGGPSDTMMPAEPGQADVRAIHCPNNHANPPTAQQCRLCGLEIAVRAVRVIPRPVLARLNFDNGLIVELDRPQLIGRRPTASGYENRSEIPNLITIPSPDQDISRIHTAIHLEGWDMLVEDLGSTNGTEVRLPGQEQFRLRDHMPVLVVPGTEVILAGTVRFRIEVPV